MRSTPGLTDHERRWLVRGAMLVAVGLILSGPPMVIAVQLLHPQPAWVDVATLADNLHWTQTLPFWFGFLLLAGNALFVLGAGRLPALRGRLQPIAAMLCVAVYGALVGFNYSVQVAWVPAAAARLDPGAAVLSMANPGSLAWTLEIFGYAFLGIAMGLVAGGFHGSRLLDTIRVMLILDAVASVLPIFLMGGGTEWVMEPGGLVGYVVWNILVFAIMIAVIVAFRPARSGR